MTGSHSFEKYGDFELLSARNPNMKEDNPEISMQLHKKLHGYGPSSRVPKLEHEGENSVLQHCFGLRCLHIDGGDIVT